MALTIRLRKAGMTAKKRYNFRIVACDSKAARDGKFIEELGFYKPAEDPAVIQINKERVNYWRKQGAVVAKNVLSILKKGAK